MGSRWIWRVKDMFLGGLEGFRMRIPLHVKVWTYVGWCRSCFWCKHNFLPKMHSGDTNGWTQSLNMLVRKQNLRVLGISLKIESRVPRLFWNITSQSVQKQFENKIKSSICYQGSDARKPFASFTRGGMAVSSYLSPLKSLHSLLFCCSLLLILCSSLLAVP